MGERLSSQSTSSVPSAHLRISLPETCGCGEGGGTITINRVCLGSAVDFAAAAAAAAAECVRQFGRLYTHRNFESVINSETLAYSTTSTRANLRSNLHLD